MKKLIVLAVAGWALIAASSPALGVPYNFGTDWDKNNLPSQVVGYTGGTFSTETEIAGFINSLASTSFVAADINKVNGPTEVNDQFYVGPGWQYLAVQYDGPNGGSVLIKLDGVDAWVPYESYNIWGNNSQQYNVSHYAVAGQVPDGGMTAALLGLGMLGLGFLTRRKA